MKKNLIALLGVVVVTVGIVAYAGPLMSQLKPAGQPTSQDTTVDLAPTELDVIPFAKEFEYIATQSGQTALDLLKQNNIIEVKEYGFGTLITGIDGLMADEKNYWAFYVNGEYAKQAADQTNLNAGDTVRFVYEPVSGSEAMDAK